MLWGGTADVIPRRLRPYENVHLDFNPGIAIDGPEGHPVYLSLVHSTYRSSTGFAEG
jgi:hypothetical protein